MKNGNNYSENQKTEAYYLTLSRKISPKKKYVITKTETKWRKIKKGNIYWKMRNNRCWSVDIGHKNCSNWNKNFHEHQVVFFF